MGGAVGRAVSICGEDGSGAALHFYSVRKPLRTAVRIYVLREELKRAMQDVVLRDIIQRLCNADTGLAARVALLLANAPGGAITLSAAA